MKRLGLIVNPIAGMGGSVGLKGTDGEEILQRAMDLGARPIAPQRSIEFMNELVHIAESIDLVTCAGMMGEDEARTCGIEPSFVVGERKDTTRAEDTRRGCVEARRVGVQLIIFCGGDGTARDVADAVDLNVPVLGIPAGVKMHSGVFAINPREAARIVAGFLSGELSTREGEVMDVDEEEFRRGRLSAKLYGYLLVPYEESLLQASKVASPWTEDERENQQAIAKQLLEEMEDDCVYVFGPGTTSRAVLQRLGLEKTLLGVDVVLGRRLLASDVNEADLLRLLSGSRAKIVVTPIGGQAHIFGRGNQQMSPSVIKLVGKENIIIIATRAKLAGLRPRRLLVDTGDRKLDEDLRGYVKVITDYREETVMKVE